MDDDVNPRWSTALRQARDGVQPTPEATDLVLQEVRRRQRRRRQTGLAGFTGVAVLALVAAVVATRSDDQLGEDRHVATDPNAGGDLFSCADNPVFTSTADPPNDVLDQWKRELARIQAASFTGFTVAHAEVTGLGVIALVTGNERIGRSVLTRDYGIAAVYGWDEDAAETEVDFSGQIRQAVQWTLDPVLRAAKRGSRGVEGSSGLSYWTSSGAVLVQWKKPVPQEIRALEDLTFPTGGRIIVREVPFSEKELHAAQLQAIHAMRSGEVPGEWTTASACGDRTGIVVGVEPASLGDQRAHIQDELADIVGLPVMVVPQEAAVMEAGRIEP